MSIRAWPTISRHRSKNAEEHLFALKADFDAMDDFLEDTDSILHKRPGSLGDLIFKGIARGLTDSVDYCLNLASECDRLLLRDIIFKHVEAKAAAKALDRIPLFQYKRLASSYKEALSKLIALAAE